MRDIGTAKAQDLHDIPMARIPLGQLLNGFLVTLLYAGFAALVVRDFASLIPYNRWTGGAAAYASLISFRVIPSLLLFWLVFGWRSLPARCIHVATATMVWLVMDERLQQWWRQDDKEEWMRHFWYTWGHPVWIDDYAAQFAGLLFVMLLLAMLSGIRLRRFPGEAAQSGWRFSLREVYFGVTALAILLGIGSQKHLSQSLPLAVAVTCCCGWCMLRSHAFPLRVLLMFVLCGEFPELLSFARYLTNDGKPIFHRGVQWVELAQAVGLFPPLLTVRMLGYRLTREKRPSLLRDTLSDNATPVS